MVIDLLTDQQWQLDHVCHEQCSLCISYVFVNVCPDLPTDTSSLIRLMSSAAAAVFFFSSFSLFLFEHAS